MNAIDPSLCREHLARILGEQNSLLAALESLLDQEFAHLSADDLEAFEKCGTARQDCMLNLLRLDDERRSLCRMFGKEPDLDGLEGLMRWCDPQGSLHAQWSDTAERTAKCRQLNDRNGLVVATRLKRVESMLNIVTGKSQAPTMYGRTGTYSQAETGRMVRREA